MKRRTVLAGALAGAGALAAKGFPVLGRLPAAAAQPAEFNLRLDDELLTLDPALMTSGEDYAVAYVVYSGLVRQTPGSTEILPDLATKWDLSPDGRTYTFHLRQGVKWQRGFGELTAADVKYSLDRIKDPKLGSRFRADLEPVRAVTAVDPYTVTITLDKPYGAFLSSVLAYRPGYIVNQRALERYGKDYSANVVGTGPYVVDQWVPGQGVHVSANKDFYGPPPKIQRAMFRIVPDASTAEIALERGDLDVSYFDVPDVMQRISRSNRVGSKSIVGPRTYWVHFNMERPPFDDVRVRQALNYATNKSDVVQRIWLGQGTVANSVLNPNMFGYLKAERYPYDPERARALLAEAGFPAAAKNKTFDFISDGTGDWPDMAAVLQQQWRAVGVRIQITALDRAVFEQRRQAHQFDMLAINSLRLEPDQILVPYFDSAQIPYPNVSSYRGADALIEGARDAVDPQKRLEFYAAAQQKIQADAPVVPLLYPNILYAWRPGVKGVVPGLLVYRLETYSI